MTSLYRLLSSVSVPAATVLVTLALLTPSRAQVTLYSDLGASDTFNAAPAYALGGPTNTTDPRDTYAMRFTATATGTVTSLQAGLMNVSGSTTATASIVSSNGTVPGTTTLFSATATGIGASGLYTFSSSSGSVLIAGMTYYAVILPDTTGIDNWGTNNMGVSTNVAVSSNNGASYRSIGNSPAGAFRVNGISSAAAPEPGSLALLTPGFMALAGGIVARRKKRASAAV